MKRLSVMILSEDNKSHFGFVIFLSIDKRYLLTNMVVINMVRSLILIRYMKRIFTYNGPIKRIKVSFLCLYIQFIIYVKFIKWINECYYILAPHLSLSLGFLKNLKYIWCYMYSYLYNMFESYTKIIC